ncbi:MAG: protein arginine kinase [Chlamydiota bacterium]|nr:protein arginine kinase [Chlamydiota bacterium]
MKPNEPIESMLSRTAGWLAGKGPEAQIVLSSRIRLARNVHGYPFSHWASKDEAQAILKQIRKVIDKNAKTRNLIFFDSSELSDLERMILLERHLISREHAEGKENRAVAISKDERVSIMINEEDHLRIQVIYSGFQLINAWKHVQKIDDAMSKSVDFAFTGQFGFLTACPTNIGTGIRASVMIHLPGLVINRQIDQVLQAVSKLGLTVRGWYGEGSQASGNLFQISNQVTLGKKEEVIIENLDKIIRQVIAHEKTARKLISSKDANKIKDRIGRSFGSLKYAHMISSGETLDMLSMLRTGIELGLLMGVDSKIVNELFLLSQPAHVQMIAGKKLSQRERDIKRAELLRKILKDQQLMD